MNQKGNITLIIIIFVVIVSLAMGVYYFGIYKPSSNQYQNIQSTTSLVVSPTPQFTISSNNKLPVANISSLSGKIVYIEGDFSNNSMILVANKDGSNAAKLLDSPNRLAFDGWSDEGKIFYYTELVGTTGTVYKKDLVSNKVVQLFTFDTSDKGIETFSYNVNVSSDSKYAIYSNGRGDLFLYNLSNNINKKILSRAECDSSPKTCFGYYYPYWSPDNKKVVVRKIFYEGATNVVINPFSNPVIEKDVKTGGDTTLWAEDSSMLIIAGAGYGEGSLYQITNLNNPINKDLLKDSIVSSAALSKKGKVLFIYDDSSNLNKVGLFDLNNNSFKTIIDSPKETFVAQKWLDDTNVILKDQNKNFWNLNIDTLQLQKLPITGDVVMAVIP